jgi:diguanylate cyclase (GGDEF)-like protein
MNDKMIRNFLKTVNPELLEQFDTISVQTTSPEALRRTHAMTVALLQHAYDLIGQAEQQMDSQSQRIESLEKLAVTDELTGLLNRRGFENAVKRELERLQRGQVKGGAFALLDLDDFKLTNDSHGHYIGDLCLKIVATCLSDMTRSTDVAGRLGGDEFAILLPETAMPGSRSFFTELRTGLVNLAISNKWPIGFSIGVAVFISSPDSSGEAIRQADELMYKMKRSGLNNIQFAEFGVGVKQIVL